MYKVERKGERVEREGEGEGGDRVERKGERVERGAREG